MREFFQNAAIIYSKGTLRANSDGAARSGSVYEFDSASGPARWLKGQYAYLAVNGLRSVMRRLQVKCDILQEEEITGEFLKNYEFIFLVDAVGLIPFAAHEIELWASRGGKLFVSGCNNIDPVLYGARIDGTHKARGYMGSLWDGTVPFLKKGDSFLMSCPGYAVPVARAAGSAVSAGKLAAFEEVAGGQARAVHLGDYDAVIRTASTLYVAPPVFEYVGGLLQGHEPFEPARKFAGEAANFYIDTLAFSLKCLLLQCGFEGLFASRHRPWGAQENVMVLRHDTDSSTDTTYLDIEVKRNLEATYAVLLDKNCRFWLGALDGHPGIEKAFHYSSTREGWLKRLLSPGKPQPSRGAITGGGIVQQVRKASAVAGFGFTTVHRHGHFFYYPETVDALDRMFSNAPTIRASQTMFRFVMQWYSRDQKSYREIATAHPEISVPFWFPFKMVVATTRAHRELPGWESGQFIEPDENMAAMVLERSKLLSGGVYTFGFHPAHANSDTIKKGGNTPRFLHAIDMARDNNWKIASYRSVVEWMNDWQDVLMRRDEDAVVLYNDSSRDIKDIEIDKDGVRHTVPLLAPGKMARVS